MNQTGRNMQGLMGFQTAINYGDCAPSSNPTKQLMKHLRQTYSRMILLGVLSLISLQPLYAQEEAKQRLAELKNETQIVLDVHGINEATKAVALYLRHLIEDKNKAAYELITTQNKAKQFIDKSNELKYLKAHSADITNMDLIGFRMISTTIISFLYVTTTQDGPMAIKVDVFSHKEKWNIAQIRITQKWDEITKMADNVRLLPVTLEFKFNPLPK